MYFFLIKISPPFLSLLLHYTRHAGLMFREEIFYMRVHLQENGLPFLGRRG